MALWKEGPPLAVYLPGAIKYIDHARKLRAQCEVYSTNLGSQFTGSAQTPYRLYDQTDRVPQNSRLYLVNAK